MSSSIQRLPVLTLCMVAFAACGPARHEGPRDDKQAAAAKAEPRGPAIKVSYSLMTDLLHMTERISLWREGMARDYRRAFDDYFGIEESDKTMLRKFAFARHELIEKDGDKGKVSFDAPFGPEGLMPRASGGAADKFWQAVLEAGKPAAVSRALAGLMQPADAENLARLLNSLAPRVGELTTERAGFAADAKLLDGFLSNRSVLKLLSSFADFAGIKDAGIDFTVHPVWAPESAAFEATAYGDRVLVPIQDGKQASCTHACLALHEIGRRLLARLLREKKALGTIRFVEGAGRQGGLFALTEGILDALSHGIAAPLMAAGPEDVPAWPGKGCRKKFAEALTPLLKKYLAAGRTFDGRFAHKAAAVYAQVCTPRPADFVDGAMVIGHDKVIEPFKSRVIRWMVWKFPPSKKYDYPRKFADNPGRSVIFLLTPRDLEQLRPRLAGQEKLLQAMKEASGFMRRERPVMITVPRKSRGYFFVIAAPSPAGMKKIARAFFALDHIPTKPVSVD